MKPVIRVLSAVMAILLLIPLTASCDRDHTGDEQTGEITLPPLTESETAAETESVPESGPAYDLSWKIPDKMPRIDIRTKNGKNDFATVPSRTNKWDYTDCTVSVSGCEEAYVLNNIAAQVKVRGNYTADYEKKPLRIKFTEKQPMLGLNGGCVCRSWVLLAEWKDSSMLRNAVALFLGRALLGSDGHYASDTCFAEVYINNQYWGLYLVAEQQQVNKHRVDVAEPAEGYAGTDIGYLIEYDTYYDAEPRDQKFAFKQPYGRMKGIDGQWIDCNQKGYTIKSDITNRKQLTFISGYVENVFRICYSAVYENKQYAFNDDHTVLRLIKGQTTEETVGAVLDIDSLVDSYILQELCCDFDVSWSSFFMSVDMSENGNGLLTFEAPWDFDSSMGIKDACKNGSGYYAANKDNPWLLLFINEPWFMDRVRAKWKEADEAGVFDAVLSMIRDYQTTYERYYKRNYSRWPNMGMNVGGELVPEAQGFKSQSNAADYLYKWLRSRIRFLGQKWGK